MAYQRQFYPGKSIPAMNRKKYMNPKVKLKHIRSISKDDVVKIMGHRNPQEGYKSIHPPIDLEEEKAKYNCPIRALVKPIPGAMAGDRIRYIQFTDSVYFAPISPYQRAWMYLSRYRGLDTGTLSGRQIIEMRERDLENLAQEMIENETFDPALTGIRGATVHGHACRLDEHGLMFDAWQRYVWDEKKGEVVYVKDQVALPLDTRISVGKPASLKDCAKRTTIFTAYPGGVDMRDDPEVTMYGLRIHKLRTLSGFQPWKVIGE